MKKIFIIMLNILLSVVIMYAQVSADPSDAFYSDVVAWEALGIVHNVPPLRPYPMPLIKKILETVGDSIYEDQVKKAAAHYERIFSSPLKAAVEGRARIKNDHEHTVTTQFSGTAMVSGDAELMEKLSLAYKLNIPVLTDYDAAVLPKYEEYPYDINDDPMEFGPLYAYVDMNAAVSYGTENVYFSAGLNRSSFGSFYTNGSVIGPQAFHAGSFSLVINRPRWSFTQAMFILGATNNHGKVNMPDKYMTLHSLDFNVTDWLTISYYENCIFGSRLDLSYLLPAPYIAVQGLGGFEDNMQMGLAFQVRPIKGLMWATDIFVDDLNANEILKFDLDTRMKFAAQTGIQFAPAESIFSLLSFDYTLVAPYMYTHSQYNADSSTGEFSLVKGSGFNYQNYTNNGKSIGSVLPPNSDRIAFGIQFAPLENLNIRVSSNIIRHANVNESLSEDEIKRYLSSSPGDDDTPADFTTDGGIFDYPDDGNGYLESAFASWLFMTQPTQMYVWQTTLSSDYTWNFKKKGSITLGGSWTFEYIKNDGVDNEMYPGTGEAITTIDTTDIETAYNAWKAKLRDIINNYFTVSVKFSY